MARIIPSIPAESGTVTRAAVSTKLIGTNGSGVTNSTFLDGMGDVLDSISQPVVVEIGSQNRIDSGNDSQNDDNTFTHTQNARIVDAWVVVKCETAENDFQVGDQTTLRYTNIGNNDNPSIFWTDSQVIVAWGDNKPRIPNFRNADNNTVDIEPDGWSYKVYASLIN